MIRPVWPVVVESQLAFVGRYMAKNQDYSGYV
jgi:hypothetical protein